MADPRAVPDTHLAAAAVILSLASAAFLYPLKGYCIPFVLLTIFFAALYAVALRQGWTLASRLPLIRTTDVSEIFLGLLLFTASVAVSWSAGIIVSRFSSDIEGILAGLVVFGFLQLLVSSFRNWT